VLCQRPRIQTQTGSVIHLYFVQYHIFLIFYMIYSLVLFGLMVINATFNNISAISWRSVLLVEEPGVPGENHRAAASHWQTLSHNVVHLAMSGIRTHNISGDRYRLYTSWNKSLLIKCDIVLFFILATHTPILCNFQSCGAYDVSQPLYF
jgi:hypothetical protein